MEKNERIKIVYEDSGISKVIKGLFVSEDDFTVTIQAFETNQVITIGKRVLIKINPISEGDWK